MNMFRVGPSTTYSTSKIVIKLDGEAPSLGMAVFILNVSAHSKDLC